MITVSESHLTPAGATLSVFVRFGALPVAQAAIITNEFGGREGMTTYRRSYNHREGRPEIGVSVYAAVLSPDGTYVPDYSTVDQVSAMFVTEEREAILVEGYQIGVGSDGEPIIAGDSCRVIK